MPRRPPPPPEEFTLADALRIALALAMVPLGALILARTLSLAVTPQGVLVGSAFIGFGVHRLWLAGSRLRLYRAHRKGAVK